MNETGREFILLGLGGPHLVEEATARGWTLWSVTGEREGRDEFTHGWSGCDPGQIYFRESVPSPVSSGEERQTQIQ